ncbi:hypothetical protein GCM10010176_009610 [Nonomuraea spiralis]|nr:hypothetical protein GCM10010176_009610 [Nonomuraea spiralis]
MSARTRSGRVLGGPQPARIRPTIYRLRHAMECGINLLNGGMATRCDKMKHGLVADDGRTGTG